MKFSIITPSLNQATFIERMLTSVYTWQGEVEVEHIVMDALSTDGTPELVREFARTHQREGYTLTLVVEKDTGQSDAINKGFRRATGDVLAWLNADDLYEPGALTTVAQVFANTDCGWCFGNCRIVDEHDREIRQFVTRYKQWQSRRYSYGLLLANDFISQPAVFFTRRLYEQVGELRTDYHLAMDYDYWLRLGALAQPVYIDEPIACFRWHGASKNGGGFQQAAHEALVIARSHAPRGSILPLLWHSFHCRALGIVYRMLQ